MRQHSSYELVNVGVCPMSVVLYFSGRRPSLLGWPLLGDWKVEVKVGFKSGVQDVFHVQVNQLSKWCLVFQIIEVFGSLVQDERGKNLTTGRAPHILRLDKLMFF